MNRLSIFVIILSYLLLNGCARDTFNRGYLISPGVVSQLNKDMTKQQTLDFLGSPSVEMKLGGDVFYYISSVFKVYIPYGEKETDREVLAVYFNPRTERISRIAHYGLKDGKIVDHISEVTVSGGSEQSVLRQFFGNIGRFNSYKR